MALLVLGIVIFLGMHLVRVVAPGLRASVIERNGKNAWMGIYTVISLIGLGLIVYGFGEARAVTGMLYNPPVFLKHISLLLMLLAFICLAAGFLPAGRIAVMVKHPQILSIKIWALAHLLANGETSSVLLFGSFLAWAVIMRISMKRRQRAGELVLPVFRSARYDLFAILIGVAAYLLFIWKLHELLIGVAPIVMG
ncbi:NnrU family protein [Rhizobium herbae]|uniref:Membrane protein n=1 Tax=Rhizobium herbae TaxID=508661 RepID=A0ABS4ETN6_9HYPH|nr:NnrU family protein [Rhizobium herbae]MBP1861156.1 putative membrane protein [Rhizobium herbae]